ncbi:MAG: O-antigen ligase family protein [Tepidiformaceae bacterium]
MSNPGATQGFPGACEGAVRWGLVALIAFTPLAFGTVERWSIAVMEWGIITLLLIALMGHCWQPASTRPRFHRATGLELPAVLFMGLCVLQTVPLPLHWLAAVAPGSARLYAAPDLRQVAAEQWPDLEVPDGDRLLEPASETRRPISLRPDLTWERIRLLAAFVSLFVLTGAWARTMDRIVFLLGAITLVGCLVGAQALVQYLTWNGRIYWVRKVPPSSAFGPFVNHNHFAGYVEMIIPVAIALSFHLFALRRHRAAPSPAGFVARGWLVEDDDSRIGPNLGALTLFGAILLLVTLFFSLSRGGILSTLASGGVLLALVWRRSKGYPVRWVATLGVPIVAASLILWIGVGPIQQRFGELEEPSNEASLQSRVVVWRAVLDELPEFAWVGAGLGSFEHSFARFTPAGSASRWDKAHNDYLQVAWETGAVGAGLAFLGALVFARRYWFPAARSKARGLDILRIGVAASILSMALHSVIDFNLQIGSNGFLFVVLCALLVSLSRLPDGEPVPVRTMVEPGRPR